MFSFKNSSTVSQSEKVSEDKKVRSDWLASACEHWWCYCSWLTKFCVWFGGWMWGSRGQVFLCISECAAGVVHACVPLAIIGDPFNHESFSWNEISLADDTKHKGLLSHIFSLNLQTLPRKYLTLVFLLLPETAHCGLCATWWRYCISFRSQDC